MTGTATTKTKIIDGAARTARALVLAAVFFGPLAGFAAAQSEENSKSLSGAGFVLYVSLMRG